jgi:hypothetical protein
MSAMRAASDSWALASVTAILRVIVFVFSGRLPAEEYIGVARSG